MIKLKAAELRTTVPTETQLKKIKKNPIYIILDDVWDTYNVGAIFRLADAVAAEKVFLCGQTETPPNTRIKKASINTTEWVAWEYCQTAVEAIVKLKVKSSKFKVIAIEQSSRSVPYTKVDYKFPIVLVVGHETNGVSKEVLEIADKIVELPMFGVNKSLNVMVSLGIVLYEVMKNQTNFSD
ncbi:MAG: TrmH family RNA methyltransferase [Candidatus Levybacteria bacterium]|nr:TrmH family RNA methyltransferase [Candidatus Levybacteria bacterium]